MGKTRRSFSPEFKFQVVMELLTGRKRRVEILREHKLSDSTLERWCQQFQERGPRIFHREERERSAEEERMAELERVIGRLTVELEASKKASNWLKSR
jgi:transposase-like protein